LGKGVASVSAFAFGFSLEKTATWGAADRILREVGVRLIVRAAGLWTPRLKIRAEFCRDRHTGKQTAGSGRLNRRCEGMPLSNPHGALEFWGARLTFRRIKGARSGSRPVATREFFLRRSCVRVTPLCADAISRRPHPGRRLMHACSRWVFPLWAGRRSWRGARPRHQIQIM